MISKLYHKSYNWWVSLPWYWKILGSVLLIGILLLGILSKLSGKHYPEDALVYPDLGTAKAEKALKDLKEKDAALKLIIKAKQKEIANKLDIASRNEEEAVERLLKLSAAQTMEELDELQLEWDL